MAAKVARPDKQVILLQGDGSFGLNGMEFDTMVRHNIPIVCVICNDEAWGMVLHEQQARGEDRVIGTRLGFRPYQKMVERTTWKYGGKNELGKQAKVKVLG